jgi:predicted GIY-YIG superfamily endonuclease
LTRQVEQPQLPMTHVVKHMCYLVHFDPRLKNAGHYIGITRTDQFENRMRAHEAGRGARVIRRALLAGSTLRVVRVWHDATFGLERTLKRRGNGARICPVCKPALAADALAIPRLLVNRIGEPLVLFGVSWPAADTGQEAS